MAETLGGSNSTLLYDHLTRPHRHSCKRDMKDKNVLKEIQRLIVEKDPNDDDKFLHKIWAICEDEILSPDTPVAGGEK